MDVMLIKIAATGDDGGENSGSYYKNKKNDYDDEDNTDNKADDITVKKNNKIKKIKCYSGNGGVSSAGIFLLQTTLPFNTNSLKNIV